MWWVWVVGAVLLWTGVAFGLAVVVGRGIAHADRRESGADGLAATAGPTTATAPVRARRRALPLPPLGVGLAAAAVLLETAGYVTRLTGASGATARLLSMDAPWSLPRLFVATLFAAAAAIALAGAALHPGRRAWWTGTALVGAAIAAVKAGSTVHTQALDLLAGWTTGAWALATSAALAAVVLGALYRTTRDDRRDRRRVLGSLAWFAVASVGLSAVSAAAGTGAWAAAATYVEESAEALAGVAFLVAVLVGVAPRAVLPASVRLRRADDEHSLEVAPLRPGRPLADEPGR